MADPQQDEQGPWSKYQSSDQQGSEQGPWTKYASTPAVTQSAAPAKTEEKGFLDKDIPLSGPWYNPTLQGVQSIGRGVRSAVQGVAALPGQAYDDVTSGHIPIIHEMGAGIRSTAKAIPQIPQAIRDINASPDPLSHYAQAAEDTAGQGAGQALLGAATEGAGKAIPEIARPVLERVTPKGIAQAAGGAVVLLVLGWGMENYQFREPITALRAAAGWRKVSSAQSGLTHH
jgi:hypothetical protein